MPRFRYQAIGPDGRTLEGVMEAADADGVAAALRAKGQWTVAVQAAEKQPGAATLSDADLALMLRELATLLSAGAPLDRALALVRTLAPSAKAGGFVDRTLARVSAGEPLSDALEKAGLGAVGGRAGLIRAGEAAGDAPGALTRLAEMLERAEALRQSIRSALLYPAMVAAAAMGALGLLVFAVLPRFEEIFLSAGAELPGLAGALLSGARWVGANFAPLAAVLAATVMAFVLWRRSEAGALALSRLALALPGLGSVLRNLDAARFCRTLGLLLQNGAPAVEAAEHARAAMGRAAMRWRTRGFAADLGSGRGLAAAIERTGAFPPLVAGLARVGEESGAAPAMLRHAADLMESAAQRSATRAVQLVAPAATLLLGGLVAMIVVSMMTAMLSLNQVV